MATRTYARFMLIAGGSAAATPARQPVHDAGALAGPANGEDGTETLACVPNTSPRKSQPLQQWLQPSEDPAWLSYHQHAR